MSYSNDPNRQPRNQQTRRGGSRMSGFKLRLIIAGAIVLFSVVSYLAKGQHNPVTGEKQRVDMNVNDEIMMGLQAAPQMGVQSRNDQAQRHIDMVGARLVNTLEQRLLDADIRNPYPFEFHLLADQNTVNAFALPGGQVFITEALYNRLTNDGQIAGVLGHEIGHVLERHGSQRMAKHGLTKGIVGAVGVAGGDTGSHNAAAAVATVVNNSYGRQDELESDRWGVELMMLAGYSPEHLLTVMDVLEETSGGAGPPEFMSTHPKPKNRREYIQRIIQEKFPNGIPGGLQ